MGDCLVGEPVLEYDDNWFGADRQWWKVKVFRSMRFILKCGSITGREHGLIKEYQFLEDWDRRSTKEEEEAEIRRELRRPNRETAARIMERGREARRALANAKRRPISR